MENFIYSSLWYHENSSRGQYVSTLNQFVDKHTVCMEDVWTLSISHYRLPDNLSARAASTYNDYVQLQVFTGLMGNLG